MGLRKFCQTCSGWFLQHEVKHIGCLSVHEIHAMILGKRRIYPQTKAHHISIGYCLQRTCGPNEDVARNNKRVEVFWGFTHDVLIERQLEVKQCLIYLLPPYPPKHRDRDSCFP